MHDAPPGGESTAQFAERCRETFALALTLQRQVERGGPLVVVTHGLVIRQMLAALPASAHSEEGEMGGRHLAGGVQEGAGSLRGG